MTIYLRVIALMGLDYYNMYGANEHGVNRGNEVHHGYGVQPWNQHHCDPSVIKHIKKLYKFSLKKEEKIR